MVLSFREDSKESFSEVNFPTAGQNHRDDNREMNRQYNSYVCKE